MWVDVAKALAIVLVVVHHCVIFANAAGWLPKVVVDANFALATFRMPLFFVASGLFAATALSRSWGEVWRRRILLYAWLYVVWVIIRYAFFRLVPDVRSVGDEASVRDLAISMVLPDTGMWFLYALGVFTVLAKALRPVPAWAQITAAGAVAVATGAWWIPVENVAWRSMGLYFVFFLIGMHASSSVRRVAAGTTRWRTAALGVLAFAVIASLYAADAARSPFLLLLVSLVAVWFGVSLSGSLSRTPVAQPLARLGSLTLPIYLVHVLVVAAVVAAVEAVVAPRGWWGAGLLVPLVVVAVGSSLLGHRLLAPRVPALFALPGWLREPRSQAVLTR